MLNPQAVFDARIWRNNKVRVYSATNSTPGTGIADGIKTSFAATAAFMLVRNTGSVVHRPKYLRLIATVAGASATSMHLVMAMDKGTTRYTSGSTALRTPTCRDMGNDVAASATIRTGALVTTAASSAVRYVGRASLQSVINVVGDEVILAFGHQEAVAANAGSLGGTVARRLVCNVGPVTLRKDQELLLHTYMPANAATAPEWEVEYCFQESAR